MKKQITYINIIAILLFGACGTQKTSVSSATPHLSTTEQNKFDYYLFEALKYKNRGEYSKQLEALNFCLDIDSTNSAANSEKGLLAAHLGNEELMKTHLRIAADNAPYNRQYQMQNILVLQSLGGDENIKEATTYAEKLKAKYPYEESVYLTLAELYEQQEEYQKAIALYDELEVFIGIKKELSFEKFELYNKLNKEKEALLEIEKLTDKYPNNSNYKILKGDIQLLKNRKEEAFKIYQEVLKNDPSNPYIYISLANYYQQQNQMPKALNAVSQAIHNPQLPAENKITIVGQYVDMLISRQQEIEETEELFKLLVEMYPLKAKAHEFYALFLKKKKRFDEALSELESVIHINPKNAKIWSAMLEIQIDRNDTTAVLHLSNEAIKEVPEVPIFYIYKAIAQYQQKRYQEAIATNEKGIRNTPKENITVQSTFYAQIGDIYHQIGNEKEAFENYEKALEINPMNISVMNNYAYFLSEKDKDLQKAERMSAKTIVADPNNATYLDTYAWILFKQGETGLAKMYIVKAIDNEPDKSQSGVMYEHYGDILKALGRDKEALEQWKKAFLLDSENTILKEKIEKNSTTKPIESKK